MHLNLKTAPTVEPITLTEAKLHLKIDGADDNTLITALIETARRLAEAETKRAFITQTWQMYMDSVAAEIQIPKPPLQSITSIRAISAVQSVVDQNSASGQALLYIAATAGFSVDDLVIINRDGEREEEKVILSIQEDVSLTLTVNLGDTHTAAAAARVEKYFLIDKIDYNVDRSSGSCARIKLREGYNWPVHRGFASFIIEFIVGYGDAGSDVPAVLKEGILELIAHLYENRGSAAIPKGLKALFWPYKIMRI